jgi:hypothetical protein
VIENQCILNFERMAEGEQDFVEIVDEAHLDIKKNSFISFEDKQVF